MGGVPSPRIPPYMSYIGKKGGTIPTKKFWEKIYGKWGFRWNTPSMNRSPLLYGCFLKHDPLLEKGPQYVKKNFLENFGKMGYISI